MGKRIYPLVTVMSHTQDGRRYQEHDAAWVKEETCPSLLGTLAQRRAGSEVERQRFLGRAEGNVDRFQTPTLELSRQIHLEFLHKLEVRKDNNVKTVNIVLQRN